MKLVEVPLTPLDQMFREPPRAYTPGSTRPVKPDDAPPAPEPDRPTEPDAPVEPDGESE
jgi:hypothetical protein